MKLQIRVLIIVTCCLLLLLPWVIMSDMKRRAEQSVVRRYAELSSARDGQLCRKDGRWEYYSFGKVQSFQIVSSQSYLKGLSLVTVFVQRERGSGLEEVTVSSQGYVLAIGGESARKYYGVSHKLDSRGCITWVESAR